jgi:hypothetical protein
MSWLNTATLAFAVAAGSAAKEAAEAASFKGELAVPVATKQSDVPRRCVGDMRA